ncbi:MAG: TIGR00159 family protein [Chloroflexota bacterium]|nr:MAG: TIGR00159 family protein [Chloroflexota bacterium]
MPEALGSVAALTEALGRASVWSAFDVAIVAIIIYGLLTLFRGTSAFSVLYGIAFLVGALLIVRGLPRLVVLNWLLTNTLSVLSIALLIVFQPELRRAAERIGRIRGLINRPLGAQETQGVEKAIDDIARACRRFAERRQGALIVLERETGLQEYAETGVIVDGQVSTEFLLQIFYPNSPLHDGAVIIHGDRLVAAGSVLPLSSNSLDGSLGTRHRAAIGITEQSDALAVVVSEETGIISLANNGRLVRNLNEAKLRKVLGLIYGPAGQDSVFHLARWRRRYRDVLRNS